MPNKKTATRGRKRLVESAPSASTGRVLVTFKSGAMDAGLKFFGARRSLRLANARDFDNQIFTPELGNADALVLSDLGIVLLDESASAARRLSLPPTDAGAGLVQAP